MSGVIDHKGQQWEHCCGCGKLVRFPQNLGYEVPTPAYEYGRDLCVECVDSGIRSGAVRFENINPAPEWVAQTVKG